MGKPKSPDPAATAAAQGQWNSFTAQQQQAMNMIGQDSPWGALEYQQSGTQTIIDPNGKEIIVPKYTAKTTLTPEQQAIFDLTQKAQTNLAGIANDQSAFLGEYLSKPFQFDNQAAADWAYDLGSSRLDPRFAQQEEAVRTRLINQGIRPGTEAYDAEMSRLGQDKNDAYNQLMLQGRGQAFSEALASRNQPLNEIIGLMSGSQVQSPNSTFAQTPQTGVAGVDYTGLVNQKYQADMSNYNSGMNALGGLFKMGGQFLFSDARLKTDIKRVGATDSGIPIYTYRYVSGGPVQMGVMAQDVEETIPDAVMMHPSGFRMVDYRKVA